MKWGEIQTMQALVDKNREFRGIVGSKTNCQVDGVSVCIGDTVRVLEGKNNNECVGVVGVFTDKISVMGLGSTKISELNLAEIVESHKDLYVGSKLYRDYFEVREFQE